MANKYVYSFEEGTKDMKNLLGGKGANLGEMTNIGLSVPAGFTLTTETCTEFFEKDEKLWSELLDEIYLNMEELERKTGKKFSDSANPLLVSVRSGAVTSMPGMMDTILNLGLNDISVKGLAKLTSNEKFAYDSYRRFIQMFSDVAMNIPKVRFDMLLNSIKQEKGTELDKDLQAEDLKRLVQGYKKIYLDEMGEEFPQDPKEQLKLSIEAVFASWNNPRAIVYRKLNDIPDELGTAVNIQSMVFGNMGKTSGTGVAFTRNPSNGENQLYGEYLIDAQGEDVVAGIRTPEEISHLKDQMPQVYEEFLKSTELLEKHYKDMQDIEFTIENGKLYFLQTRNGKRTAQAGINIAVDLVEEGLLTREEGIMSINPNDLNQLLHPAFDKKDLENAKRIAKGLSASPGASTGRIYFNSEDLLSAKGRGEKCILVRQETSPEDIEGMISAEGILTSRGGMTSHAAVVARGMGKCCIAGCTEIRVDEAEKIIIAEGKTYKEGDVISLDGETGIVYSGEIKKAQPELGEKFQKFMTWVDEIKELGIRTNADTPKELLQAVEFGAEGVGLCRTEHMFFNLERLPAVRKMILAKDFVERQEALKELLSVQREDFHELFKAVGDKPITIRLLDPPLHEFLPHSDEDRINTSTLMKIDLKELESRIESLSEVNPMLGHRGCRLAVTYPEIYRMQARAIVEAALDVKAEAENLNAPEIMIPLVSHIKELEYVKGQVVEEIEAVFRERNERIKYIIGTMIEVPRAALTADEIAREAEFFSFGTNDLTQMGFGFSRDDSGKFLSEYMDKKILDYDPFQRIDQKGIGKLMEIAVDLGKETRPDIQLGICGEHGGEPTSVEFCHKLGLHYVSCSPYRVPIARLAAAQAVIVN